MGSRAIKALVLFVLVYGALYFLGMVVHSAKPDLPIASVSFDKFPWQSDYTMLLMPIVGFWFVFFLIPYLRKEFGFGKIFIKFALPVLLLAGSYLAFYLAVYLYHYNNASLAKISMSDYLARANLDFTALFLGSAFFYFVLAGLGGWFAALLIDKFEGQEKV